MPKSVPFSMVLSNYLQDPEKAMSYLRSALEENDPVLFEAVIQDVIKAQGQSGRLMPFLTKLADSLQRDGVEDEMIKAIVAEMSESFVDAA
jgi:cation transport regulator ChaC